MLDRITELCSFCDECTDCTWDYEVDAYFIHELTVHVEAKATLTCSECGNEVKTIYCNSYTDLDWILKGV